MSLAEWRYLFSFRHQMTGVIFVCMLWGCFVHVDVRPRYYHSHNACLESRDQTSKRICVCQPLRTLVGSLVTAATTHPVNIFTLYGRFGKEFHCSIFTKIRKSIFSFVQIVIQMSSISVDFFIPFKFYIIAIFGLSPWSHVLKYAQVESENIFLYKFTDFLFACSKPIFPPSSLR